MEIRRHEDAAGFAARVEPWLVDREAEHNVLLGVLRQLRSGRHDYASPIYLAEVASGGEVRGCAFRTPPFSLGLTRMPAEAMAPLVTSVADTYSELPGVVGPEPEATAFAEGWRRARGGDWSVGARMRIHVLERVEPPAAPPDGALRVASEADLPLLTGWLERFAEDTGSHPWEEARRAERLLAEKAIALWDHGGPRSMVASPATTPSGARVGYVYTPPPLRGRGYASAAVAAFSQKLLGDGRRFCFLYTDLANPTSNAIYARLGYAPLCDVVDLRFAKGLAPGYRIVRAAPEHLPRLPEVELRAARLFEGQDVAEGVLADATSLEQFRTAQEEGLLWVALSPEGEPVGFAFVERVDGAAHLDELDVDPAHGRRGLGAALVRTVCAWAKQAGLPRVTLTTFRDVPWNAPFYARMGFRALDPGEWSPALAELVRQEGARGLDPARRVVMRFDTGAG